MIMLITLITLIMLIVTPLITLIPKSRQLSGICFDRIDK